jgi:HEAT repeat protein
VGVVSVDRSWDRLAYRQQRLAAKREYTEHAQGVLADLRAAGFEVEAVQDLRDGEVGDERAVPILIEWMPKVTLDRVRLDIIHTLGSRWARPKRVVARALLDQFHAMPITDEPMNHDIRFAIGDMLRRVVDESALEEVVAIARDTRHGGERDLVVAALGNMRKARERLVPVLIELLPDFDVRVGAAIALGRLKDPAARPHLERWAAEETDSWRRKDIVRALNKLPETAPD